MSCQFFFAPRGKRAEREVPQARYRPTACAAQRTAHSHSHTHNSQLTSDKHKVKLLLVVLAATDNRAQSTQRCLRAARLRAGVVKGGSSQTGATGGDVEPAAGSGSAQPRDDAGGGAAAEAASADADRKRRLARMEKTLSDREFVQQATSSRSIGRRWVSTTRLWFVASAWGVEYLIEFEDGMSRARFGWSRDS